MKAYFSTLHHKKKKISKPAREALHWAGRMGFSESVVERKGKNPLKEIKLKDQA